MVADVGRGTGAARAQADALEIEIQAKRRLADEYDAAQERGEVAVSGKRSDLVPNENKVPTTSDLSISRKDIYEGRLIRDARAQRYAHATALGP